MTSDRTRFIVGCMTGTSLDGLDAALVKVTGRGRSVSAELIEHVSRPFGKLRGSLNRLARGLPSQPVLYLRAARDLGEFHADLVADLCEKHGDIAVDFIVAHGQTIWHAPDEHMSWQLFDPWPIVHRIKCPVLYDLRQADLVAGGQGAPITVASDGVMFPGNGRARLIINLGGVCNVSMVPASDSDELDGFDLCPCNILVDGVVRNLFPEKLYDDGGMMAGVGKHSDVVFNLIMKHPFFEVCPNRSTGREDFDDDWIENLVAEASEYLEPNDLIASAVEAVAIVIGRLVKKLRCPQVVLAGGGTKNMFMVNRIKRLCEPAEVLLSTDFGIPVEAREAMGLAVLGALSHDGVPITLTRVTGAKKPGVAGAWAGRI
jgi:1,6-anhydro-N-acetylmuramate kinase